MRMITATEANRDFSKLLERVEKGDTVNITKHGRIVATIRPRLATAKDEAKKKRAFMEKLRQRKPFAQVTSRGTRDELYDN